MATAVVVCEDLDVNVKLAPIELVLNPQVGEVNALVEIRQVVIARPLLDLLVVTVRPPVAVGTVPIVLLEEALVVALEFLLEDDAADLRALVSQARLFSELCPPPNIPEPCDVAPGGGQFLVVELVAWSEEDVLLFDSIFMEAFQSHVVYERGEIGSSTLQMLLDSTGRQIPTGIQVVFSVLPPSAAGQNVDLYWPGSQPVRVPVSV